VISIKECYVIGGTESLHNDKGNGVIGIWDIIVGAVNVYFSRDVNTARALNGCCIEAVVNFTLLGGHCTLATSKCKEANESERRHGTDFPDNRYNQHIELNVNCRHLNCLQIVIDLIF